MAVEELRDRARVLAVPRIRSGERLQPAEDEPRVERPGHGAERVLEEGEPLCDGRIVRAGEAADEVGVAAEVLRRRVDDDVGAELERPLEVRGRERVVDDEHGAPAARAASATARMSTTFSSGFVGDSIQTSRVRSSIASAMPSARRVRELVALRLVDLREEPVGAAVDVVDGDDPVARRDEVHDRRRRAHPGREREPVVGALERGEAASRAPAASGSRSASSRSPCARRPPPGRRSRSGRSGR